jgi:uncharacterized membrane protein
MSAEPALALDRRVAFLLHLGTWLASAVIAIGLVLPAGARVVTAGIALFVALPIARVTVMLVEFLRRRDYRIALITALVLAVILLGIVLSLQMNAGGG